jgi:hypothetical protein
LPEISYVKCTCPCGVKQILIILLLRAIQGNPAGSRYFSVSFLF